ncbi:translation initiation factor IF-1, chloroplastic [Prosopis cineraria]|uniref:translation initiation factor IF-1, chloroplastic n=1 Tax=Prosopis cineraria TaxID=364024 RepID=UPI00240FB897|nr:translation initiation factor IF-1, chloroplastic [Prosopis cineraria]
MLASSLLQYRSPILHTYLLPSRRPSSSSFRLQPNSTSHSRSPLFLKSHPLLETKPLETLLVQAKSPPADRSNESKWVHEGLITESLPNGMFRVRLDNEDLILGYISGKIRKNFVRILPGDRVKVEVSRYDSSRGRIVYRLRGSS